MTHSKMTLIKSLYLPLFSISEQHHNSTDSTAQDCDTLTKVSDLGVHVRIEQHILRLKVPVHNHVSVAVVDR